MLCHNQSLIELAIAHDSRLQPSDRNCILSGVKKSNLKRLHLNNCSCWLGTEEWADLCDVVKSLHELVLTSHQEVLFHHTSMLRKTG